MKAESTDKAPKLNLLKPDGIRSQGHAEDVIAVALNNGETYPIVPGSFKFYTINSNKGVPYVTFKIDPSYVIEELAGLRMEIFPASMTGFFYKDAADSEVSDDSVS